MSDVAALCDAFIQCDEIEVVRVKERFLGPQELLGREAPASSSGKPLTVKTKFDELTT